MKRLSEAVRAYGTIVGNRSLRRALGAFLAFNTQENGVWIAIVVYAYDRGGATTAGAVAIAQLVPAAIVAPLASVLGDRLRRDHALTLGYAIQGVANLSCALALWLAPPLVVYAAAVVAACAITLTRPVHHALLPELSDTPEELTAANSVSSSMEGIGMLSGPAIAAGMLAAWGPGSVLALFAAMSAAGSAVAARLQLVHPDPGAGPGASEAVDAGGLVLGALGGLRELREEPGAATLTVLGSTQFFVLGALDVFYALLAIDVLRAGEQGAGLLASAVGVGGLVGAGATVLLVGRRRLTGPILVGLMVTGGALAAVGGASELGVAAFLLVVCGAGRTFFDVATRTLLQRTIRDEVLARVFGVQEGLIMVVLAIGSAAVPLLVALAGERGAFLVAGSVMPILGVASWRTLRAVDRRADVPDSVRLELLGAIELFQPLAQPVLEQVARRLIPLRASSGEVVIREGDHGDRFYVLASGEAAVGVRGQHVTRLGPGAYFGEIALLRDVPRTATVTITQDAAMFALERDDFLAAVAGIQRSAEVHRGIDRRLSELDGTGERGD